MTSIAIRRLDPDVPLPTRAHSYDAGVDLTSTIDFHLARGARHLVPTGIAIDLPVGAVGLIHPRSGLALRAGLSIVNAVGVIDAGYRGELKVCLINLGESTAVIERGDRIAQLLIQRVEMVDFHEVDEFAGKTDRGTAGYGSSGGHAILENR